VSGSPDRSRDECLQLSVVIASHDAAAVIERCLAALATQREDAAMEVVVADSSRDGTSAVVADGFPWVRLLHFDEPLTVPQLRGRAIQIARGEIVAILDPYSVAASDWVRQVVRAHGRSSHPVIGGAVDLDAPESRSLAAWAIYLNEYGLFVPPIPAGPTWIVPGSNVSYKRSVLFDGERARYPVFWKTFVNWTVEQAGSALWLEPAIKIGLNKPIPFGDFLRTRYHHGRCFAAMRVKDARTAVRAGRAASTLAVPLLTLARWIRGFWPKRRYRARFVLTLPAQLALFTVWAWGELCGYLGGDGKSCDQLFY
jgi:glycosyltransferase involved in cell wall biosynthesis